MDRATTLINGVEKEFYVWKCPACQKGYFKVFDILDSMNERPDLRIKRSIFDGF